MKVVYKNGGWIHGIWNWASPYPVWTRIPPTPHPHHHLNSGRRILYSDTDTWFPTLLTLERLLRQALYGQELCRCEFFPPASAVEGIKSMWCHGQGHRSKVKVARLKRHAFQMGWPMQIHFVMSYDIIHVMLCVTCHSWHPTAREGVSTLRHFHYMMFRPLWVLFNPIYFRQLAATSIMTIARIICHVHLFYNV